MRFVRGWASFAGSLLLGCGSDAPSPPAPSDDGPPVVGVPRPCETTTVTDAPILALEWDRSLETYLPIGAEPTVIALDYDVHPRSHVERVSAVFQTGAAAALEPFALEETCPLTIDFDELTAPLEGLVGGDVAVASVSAAGGDGTVREASLFWTFGTLPEVEVAVPEELDLSAGSWWLLFEPAAGPGRVALAPVSAASIGRPMRLPSIPGEVALVETSALTSSRDAVHAPTGFAADWRTRVSSWFGSIVAAPLQQGERVRLAARGEAGGPPVLHDLSLAPPITADPIFAAVSGLGDQSFELSVVCPASAVNVTVLGFGHVRLGSAIAGPGETATSPVECHEGEGSLVLPLDVENANGRRWPLLLSTTGVEQ